ncbi:MAG TPA: glycosyltransferase family 39 protein [Mycobacteriales bacterium]|nr:glycosyltransferase family 39 protein [Mycobacteriales bacterium]
MSRADTRLRTEPAEVIVSPVPPPPTVGERWWASAPEAFAVATAGFAVPAVGLLLAGWFVLPLVLLLGGTGAALAVWLLGPEPGLAGPGRRGWTVAALALAGLSLCVNARYASQDLYAARDPATYVLAGQWLTEHASLPVDTQPEVFGSSRTGGPTYGDSAGFRPDLFEPGTVYPQGNHLLPALLAVAGWLGGVGVLLKANALLGALALLALFGLARRLTGPPFALVATAALAVSMPMIAFSRDAYTEPLALLLLFGGLSVLCRAVRSGRPAEFALAGLTVGASVMDRVDGYAPLLAALVVGIGYAARAGLGERRAAARRAGLLVLGLALPSVLGYLDVAWLSSGYYSDLRSQILPLLAATAAAVPLGAVVVALAWRWRGSVSRPARLARWVAGRPARARWAWLAAVGVVASFALLVSRPWWQVAHEQVGLDRCNSFVPQVQAVLGQPIEPCRTYDEYTVHWLAWYFGWPAVVLGVLGLALLVWRTVRSLDLWLLGPVAMTLIMCALYLWHAAITPDQVWAMRRYLPVVVPGLLAAAAYLLAVLWERPPWRGRQWGRAVALGLAALLVGGPAAITHPMQNVRQYVPQLAQVRLVCERVGDAGAVLVIGKGMAGAYLQTMRSVCGVPAQAIDHPTAGQLARIRAAVLDHGRRLYVITQDHIEVPWAGPAGPAGPAGTADGEGAAVTAARDDAPGRPPPYYTARELRWPTRLTDVPQQAEVAEIPLWLGTVLPDGTVRPALPQG